MAKRKKAVEVLEGAGALTEANTYIRRLVEDAELRETFRRAVVSGGAVYERVSHVKRASKLNDDTKLHADAVEAIDALRAVADSLAVATESGRGRSKRGSLRHLVLLAGAGAAAALVTSEGLRSKVLDALFGAEEEFTYTPPPAAATDAPGSPLSAV